MRIPSLLLALTLTGFSAEPSRTWTDNQGRKLEGILKEKTETTASILLKSGKRAELKIADLSQADRDYIAKAEVFPEVEMVARTVKVDSNEAGTKIDRRAVEVTVKKLHGRKFDLAILWLGPDGNTVGIYKADKQLISRGETVIFKMDYIYDQRSGGDYKGYTVALLDEKGMPDVISSSQEPFKRFWDEQWRKKLIDK